MISLDDEDEMRARQLARDIHGGKKGSLSEVFSQALKVYFEGINKEKLRSDAKNRIIARLEKGLDIGYIAARKRSDLYEYRTKSSSGY